MAAGVCLMMMRLAVLAAGVPVLGTNTEWTACLSGGRHFRAMSPRDSDDVGAWVALPRKGAADGVSERDQVRAELAVRFGVDFRAQPQSFLLELRPEAREEGPPDVMPTQRESDCDVDIEFVSELSGDLDELCESFLRHAEVRVLNEEEYDERKRVANYSDSRCVAALGSSHGSNVTVRVLKDQSSQHTRSRLGVVSDHALDGVNASIRAALQKKLRNLPPPPGPASYPRPGDYLQPGPFGLEQDWSAPQEAIPTDFEVIHDPDKDSGKVEVRFSVGDQWEQGDGADMLLEEELRRRMLLRKREKRDLRRDKKTACVILQQQQQQGDDDDDGDGESSIDVKDLLAEGETLESLTDDLVAERLLGQSEAELSTNTAGMVRPGGALQLSDSMIEAYAKQFDFKHLNAAEHPMDMRGLSITEENGLGLAELARHHWQREADTEMARRWFRQALLCSPSDVDVLVQYGLFLVDALGAYGEAQHVFRCAIKAASSSPTPIGYALTGYAECALHLQGYLRGAGREIEKRVADQGLRQAERLLELALKPPSEAEALGWVGRRRVGGPGIYDHYPRALTLLARVREEVHGSDVDAKELLERAVGWSPSCHSAVAALGCLLSRSSSAADLARAEQLLASVLRAHVRRLKFWVLRQGGSWRRDNAQAGLRVVTSRLWIAYARTVLLRGADANVGLAHDLAVDTIIYSEDVDGLGGSACSANRGREAQGMAGYRDDDGGITRRSARGAAVAEGARCCLAALLLCDGEANGRFGTHRRLGSSDGHDGQASLESGTCGGVGGVVPSVDDPGTRGMGRIATGGPVAGLARDAEGADAKKNRNDARVRRTKLCEAEALLMGVFFHDDRHATALALYGAVLWMQRKFSTATRVLAKVTVLCLGSSLELFDWRMDFTKIYMQRSQESRHHVDDEAACSHTYVVWLQLIACGRQLGWSMDRGNPKWQMPELPSANSLPDPAGVKDWAGPQETSASIDDVKGLSVETVLCLLDSTAA